jgi:hypothetical protein
MMTDTSGNATEAPQDVIPEDLANPQENQTGGNTTSGNETSSGNQTTSNQTGTP